MGLTVSKRLLILNGVGVVTAVAIGLGAHVGSRGISGSIDEMATASAAVSYQMESDMLHDALRADVMAAMLAEETDAARQSVRDENAEHVKRMAEVRDTAEALDLSPGVKAHMHEVRTAVNAYTRAAA